MKQKEMFHAILTVAKALSPVYEVELSGSKANKKVLKDFFQEYEIVSSFSSGILIKLLDSLCF